MTRLFSIVEVRRPEDVRNLLADPERHWRPGYSACELARSWVHARGLPSAISTVLATKTMFAGAELVEAFFERKVQLETPGRLSQCDVLAYLKLASGFLVMAVEGKVKEPFGPYVWEKKLTPGVERRIENLCDRLDLTRDQATPLRYQLLHRSVSAILEAQRYGAEQALMMVHSFCPYDTSFGDYREFAGALGIPSNQVRIGRILGPVSGISPALYLGWTRDSSSMQVGKGPSPGAGRTMATGDRLGGKMTTSRDRMIEQLRLERANRIGSGPPTSVVSSRVSAGFKRLTGRDYKRYYDQDMRRMIAELGTHHGIALTSLVNLAIELREESDTAREQVISRILG